MDCGILRRLARKEQVEPRESSQVADERQQNVTRISRPMVMAMLSSAAITAQFVSGRATRDALFLTSLGITALPMMLIATSLCSLLLVTAHARGSARVAPQV